MRPHLSESIHACYEYWGQESLQCLQVFINENIDIFVFVVLYSLEIT